MLKKYLLALLVFIAGLFLAPKVMAIGSPSQLALSNYAFTTWTPRALLKQWAGVSMSADGKYQTASDYFGYLYTSDNFGIDWTSRGIGASWRTTAMSSDGKIQAAVVENGRIYNSTDYGANWTARGVGSSWYGIAISSDGKIQTAVRQNQNIYTSNDYGVNWTTSGVGKTWTAVAMSSDGKIQTAIAFSGNIYTSGDFGAHWTSRGITENWRGIGMSADGKIQTAAIMGGGIYYSTDYGATWTLSNAPRKNWRYIAMTSDGMIQLSGAVAGELNYISTDGGVNWASIRGTGSGAWLSGAMSADGKYLTVASYGGKIYTSGTDSYFPYGNFGIGTSSPRGLFQVGQDVGGLGNFMTFAPPNGNGFLGLGVTAPASQLHLSSVARTASVRIDRYSGSTSDSINGPPIVSYAARGSESSPTSLVFGDQFGGLAARGYAASDWSDGSRASILFKAAESWTATSQGSYIDFTTTKIGTATNANVAMRLDNNGYLGIGTTSPTQRLDISGGIRIVDNGVTKPICDDSTRGTLWFTKFSVGTSASPDKDKFEICAQDEKQNSSWRTLY